jgi:hypothetical protein
MTARPTGFGLREKEYVPGGGGVAPEYFNDWVRLLVRE